MSDTPLRVEPASPLKLRLFNPRRLSDADLERSFIARQKIFRALLDDVVSEPADGRPQHHLIVGQRGMGKTTLLQRLAVELKRDPHRTGFLPLSFPEEQYVEVDRLSKFWLNCLDALADALEAEGERGPVAEIDAAVKAVEKRSGDEKEAEYYSREAFTEAWRRAKRRPVLLIDNFNLLLNRLKEHDFALRGYFTAAGAPVLVGACTNISDRLEDYGAAFYDGFKYHWLRPLTLDEMSEVVERLAKEVGRQDVLNRVAHERPRMAALRDLTGGNPRTAVLLFDLFAKGVSEDAYGDLESLLDIVTPLYQSRLEQLSEQAQVIVGALAREWHPVTVAEVCQATGLENKSVSPQLGRLEDVGLVEKTAVFPSKRAGYQIAERFFNVWYLMRFATRRQRASLSSLTRFLQTFHTPAERALAARRLLSETALACEKVTYAMAVADSLSSDPGLAYELAVKAQLDLVEQMKGVRERIAEVLEPSDIESRIYAFAELREKLRQAVPAGASVTGQQFADLVLGSPSLVPDWPNQEMDRDAIAGVKVDVSQIEVLLGYLRREEEQLNTIFGKQPLDWLRSRLQRGILTSWNNTDQITKLLLSAEDGPAIRILVSFGASSSLQNLSDEAFEHICRILEPRDGASAESWHNWGYDLQMQLARYPEAERAYRKAIALDPKYAHPWNNLGNLLVSPQRKYEEAEEAYRQAIKLDATFAIPWNNLGNLLREHLGRYAEAEQAYRKAIALDPNYVNAWNGLGNLLQYQLGRYAEAEQAYREAIALDPKFVHGWSELGNLLQHRLGKYEEAEQAYRQAISLDPGHAVTWNRIGNLYQHQLKKYDEAEQVYRAAIAINPRNAQPWDDLGDLLKDHLGRYEEAERAYRQAITLDPQLAYPWSSLGDLLQERLGRYEEAEQAYRKAIAAVPTFAPAWNGLGNLLQYHLGRYEEAEQAYRQAIAAVPNVALVWNNLGDLLQLYLGRYEEAERAYRQAITIDPKYPRAWTGLGILLQYQLGRYEEAEQAYRQAIAIDPNEAPPWNGLGNLLAEHLGQFEDARAAFAKSVDLDPSDDAGRHNLAFLLRDFLGDPKAARKTLADLRETQRWKDTRALQDALFAAYDDNWGLATTALRQALQVANYILPPTTRDDWFRASAVLLHRGFGEKLVEFLKEEGADIKMLPWFAAVEAHTVGDRRYLLNIAVEARSAAEKIYDEIQKRRELLAKSVSARWEGRGER